MKNSIRTIAWAIAGLAAVSAAQAEGLYVGGSVGGSHDKGSQLDGLDASRSDTGLKVYGGYSFTPNFSLEAGYADLGQFDNAARGLRAKAWYLDGVATVPLGNNFSALARIGAVQGKLNDTALGSDTGTGYKLGAGLQYDIDRNLGVRAEWERYRFDAFDTRSKTDVYSIGVNYKF